MSRSSFLRALWLLGALVLGGVALVAWLGIAGAADATVHGLVVSAEQPLAGARVRVRATDNLTFSAADGTFLLTGLTVGAPIEVTAWYSGHYIAAAVVTPTVAGVTLTLRPLHDADNPDYDWASPYPATATKACGDCHPMILPQWAGNAHGQAVENDRFFSLYAGTNLGATAVVTPGYLLDFPATAGNCANCHAPGAAVDGYLSSNMLAARGVLTAGISCDFCHKVAGVYLNPATGTVYPNAPGVQSMRVLRPPAGDDVFFGPFDDIPDPDTYLALMDESQFCAACHQFSFWGTPIYESYNEWLASPAAAAGVSCQDCHMPPTGESYYALPEVGGLPHPPAEIPSHLQPGAASEALLQESVLLSVQAAQRGEQLQVTVVITNSGAGHHLPTDHPGRNMILTVQATGGGAGALPQLGGPQVPAWGGAAAGLPGHGFAKVLADVATGRWPVVSYWRPTVILEDSRIPAGAADRSDYIFQLPAGPLTVDVRVELYFRRLYPDLAAAREWPAEATLLAAETLQVAAAPWRSCYLPALIAQQE